MHSTVAPMSPGLARAQGPGDPGDRRLHDRGGQHRPGRSAGSSSTSTPDPDPKRHEEQFIRDQKLSDQGDGVRAGDNPQAPATCWARPERRHAPACRPRRRQHAVDEVDAAQRLHLITASIGSSRRSRGTDTHRRPVSTRAAGRPASARRVGHTSRLNRRTAPPKRRLRRRSTSPAPGSLWRRWATRTSTRGPRRR